MQNISRKRNRIRDALMVALAAQIILEEEEEEEEKERRKQPRRFWVNPYLRQRRDKGKFENEFEYLRRNPEAFFKNFHMSESTFNSLFGLLQKDLTSIKNTRTDAISPKAKLAMILEFMVSGSLQIDICTRYRISSQHLGRTIDLVCNAICRALSSELPQWNTDLMLQCASEFMNTWNFPNCVGALGSTRMSVKEHYKSEESDSIILIAICNASYRFTYIDVEYYKCKKVNNIFSSSRFGKTVSSDSLEFPPNSLINGKSVPYFVVGDQSFPIDKRIMRPFGTRLQKSKEQRVFNSRIGQIQKCIDNTLGILNNRWLVSQSTMRCNPERAKKIVRTCCYLHNYLMRTSPKEYGATEDFVVPENNVNGPADAFGRFENYPQYVRNAIKDYVNSKSGAVPWQIDPC